jgi:hypothetical protein
MPDLLVVCVFQETMVPSVGTAAAAALIVVAAGITCYINTMPLLCVIESTY